MKRFFAIATFLFSAAVVAAPPVAAPPPATQQYIRQLGVGMVVDWARTEQGIREFDPLVVRDFSQRGIHHVRIRVAGAATEQHLLHLRKIVEACEQYGVIPIISYQAEAFRNDPSLENARGVVAWWRTVTGYFAGVSPQLGFDVIFEPGDKFNRNPAPLNRLYDQVLKAIHTISPQRVVFIAPHLRAAPEALASLKWPFHNNGVTLAEWHIFPWGPVKSNGKYPWTTGTLLERASIRARIHAALRWQQKTGLYSWLGAWSAGEIARNASLKNPVAFATFMACELQKARIPYAINPDTWFYDGEEGNWRTRMQPLLDAMIKPDCSTFKNAQPDVKPGRSG
ncbi:cellulase family glycosylhydrolase [Entomohabitans teleogrylli]|uniref:cellulase family glycosylhydrolase n=1 Tax=Entomohabitans teleogrylli TaxID=1384589 RepID=UPI002013079F|nr:cellulase family glycosylhydrolase [Entomohabitans teleogrylli]